MSLLSRHKDKDAEFVTLCKNLRVTDPVCDQAWMLYKTVQDSLDDVSVCINDHLMQRESIYFYTLKVLNVALDVHNMSINTNLVT